MASLGENRRAAAPCQRTGVNRSIAGTISAALGFAVANKLAGTPGKAIAVIGDGAMSAGMAYEAMNNAGAMDSRLIEVDALTGPLIVRSIVDRATGGTTTGALPSGCRCSLLSTVTFNGIATWSGTSPGTGRRDPGPDGSHEREIDRTRTRAGARGQRGNRERGGTGRDLDRTHTLVVGRDVEGDPKAR